MKKINDCRNFNHGRMMVSIQYCPACGEKFNVHTDVKSCSEQTHNTRRKERDLFCCDCGLSLTPRKAKTTGAY